jgi:hypothetical protein
MSCPGVTIELFIYYLLEPTSLWTILFGWYFVFSRSLVQRKLRYCHTVQQRKKKTKLHKAIKPFLNFREIHLFCSLAPCSNRVNPYLDLALHPITWINITENRAIIGFTNSRGHKDQKVSMKKGTANFLSSNFYDEDGVWWVWQGDSFWSPTNFCGVAP